MLLSAGASHLLLNNSGETPLIAAAATGRYVCAALLCAQSNDDPFYLDHVDGSGTPALGRACERGHSKVAVELIRRHAASASCGPGQAAMWRGHGSARALAAAAGHSQTAVDVAVAERLAVREPGANEGTGHCGGPLVMPLERHNPRASRP